MTLMGLRYLNGRRLRTILTTIAIVFGVSMIFAIAIGYFLFAEVPTLQTLAGGALIAAAGILIIWRESRLGMNRDKPRGAGPPPQV